MICCDPSRPSAETPSASRFVSGAGAPHAAGQLARALRRLAEAVGELVGSSGPLAEAGAKLPGAAARAAQAALEPRQLRGAGDDRARELAQDGGALEQLRRPQHRLDALEARDLLLEPLRARAAAASW